MKKLIQDSWPKQNVNLFSENLAFQNIKMSGTVTFCQDSVFVFEFVRKDPKQHVNVRQPKNLTEEKNCEIGSNLKQCAEASHLKREGLLQPFGVQSLLPILVWVKQSNLWEAVLELRGWGEDGAGCRTLSFNRSSPRVEAHSFRFHRI